MIDVNLEFLGPALELLTNKCMSSRCRQRRVEIGC